MQEKIGISVILFMHVCLSFPVSLGLGFPFLIMHVCFSFPFSIRIGVSFSIKD